MTSADLEAERTVLGSLFGYNARDNVAVASNLLSPHDFALAAHGEVFAWAVDQHRRGHKPDDTLAARSLPPDTVDALGGPETVASLSILGVANVHPWCERLVKLRLWRDLARLAADLADKATARVLDPLDVLDAHRVAVASIEAPTAGLPAGYFELDEFGRQPAEGRAPWVVPGLLREDWRAVIVAPEGIGKSVLVRQMAACVGRGIHPFTFRRIPPVSSLIVDFENPADVISASTIPLSARAKEFSRLAEANCHIWTRPGGINLRSRADRADFEACLADCRPKLVVGGPVYKMVTLGGKEDLESSTLEFLSILDNLRTRYRFALVLEHHAGHGDGHSRELRPFGSSAWRRWPEFGRKLVPDENSPRHVLHVEEWRLDRIPAAWPDEIHRGVPGREWPWVAKYPPGNTDREDI